MSDWSNRFWPAGTIVRVLECLQDGDTRYLGEGELINDFYPSDEDTENLTVDELFENSPIIQTNEGRKLRGYQCWWIPLEMVENV